MHTVLYVRESVQGIRPGIKKKDVPDAEPQRGEGGRSRPVQTLGE